jgi:hypothetical protein
LLKVLPGVQNLSDSIPCILSLCMLQSCKIYFKSESLLWKHMASKKHAKVRYAHFCFFSIVYAVMTDLTTNLTALQFHCACFISLARIKKRLSCFVLIVLQLPNFCTILTVKFFLSRLWKGLRRDVSINFLNICLYNQMKCSLSLVFVLFLGIVFAV